MLVQMAKWQTPNGWQIQVCDRQFYQNDDAYLIFAGNVPPFLAPAKFEEILSFFADILSKSGKVEPILSSRRAISRPIDKLFPWKISIIYQLGY